MRNTCLALAAGALMALGFAAADASSNGITTFSGSFGAGPAFYLDCVDEPVTVEGWYDVRFHQFTTKSGTTHILGNWSYRVLYTGVATGRQWYGEGVSPGNDNYRLDKGLVSRYTSFSRMTPLDGGPSFIFRVVWKITLNANGEPTATVEPDPERAYVCLGPR